MEIITLFQAVQKLDISHEKCTVYAVKPWAENSKAMILREFEGVPLEAGTLGLKYFLEVAIANDFIQEWIDHLDVVPSPQQKCSRLIQHAMSH